MGVMLNESYIQVTFKAVERKGRKSKVFGLMTSQLATMPKPMLK